jgi:hypothetical protein
MRTIFRISALIIVAVSLPAAAWACLNAVTLEGNRAVKQIRKAEKLLARGQADKARRLVDPFRYDFEGKGLQRRADIVIATADVRRLRGHRDMALFEEARKTLADLHAEHKNDPLIAARYAEALAAAEPTRGRALAILQDLEKRDLMPDAFAYRTLARLHHAAGNSEASNAAMSRCRKTAERRRVCTLSDKSGSLSGQETMQTGRKLRF